MSGVGKTQTALAYSYNLNENYHSVFWISGVNQAAILSGFEKIRTETGCIMEASNLTETAKLVIKWLQEQENWLLVIDNLDDVSIIEGFLPSTDCMGHTLIMTCNPNTNRIPAQGIEVEILDIDVGAKLFRVHIGVEFCRPGEARITLPGLEATFKVQRDIHGNRQLVVGNYIRSERKLHTIHRHSSE